MGKSPYLPVIQLFVDTLRKGTETLDKTVLGDMIDFLRSQQHENGCFMDRSGSPDLYYSLFGAWLSLALDQDQVLGKHRNFIDQYKLEQHQGVIDELAWALIKISLASTEGLPSSMKIFRHLLSARERIDMSYRIFLWLLMADARGWANPVLKFVIRSWIFFMKPPDDLPCSIVAAMLFVKHRLGMGIKTEKKKLLGYYNSDGGFGAFPSLSSPDMLSTAVALFVLQIIGYDLRLIAPACLDFVEGNYDSGAFISGDGDETRDLEYTFYGLLSLGSLAGIHEG